MQKKNIYLAQVNWGNCAGNTAGYWLPYSIASLWAFVKQNEQLASKYELKGLLFRRDRIENVLNSLCDPTVFGISTYVWNENYNLQLASAVKRQFPKCYVVAGGPQIPEDPKRAEEYLERNDFLDILIHNEGEFAFERLLEVVDSAAQDFSVIPGCTVRTGSGVTNTGPQERIRDLSKLPSPYLTGVFDDIMRENPSVTWNAVIETNRGCPYKCTFCDWGTLTYSKMEKFGLQRVFDEIRWLSTNQISYVFPADSNFGIFAERDSEIVDCFIKSADEFGFPSSIGMNFAKNSNERLIEMAARLHAAGLLKALTLSVQSLSEAALTAIERRNMKINRFSEILKSCNENNVPTYTEMILGLPEETYASWKSGLCKALRCGQHGQLETWLLEMLENAPMNAPESRQKYGIKSKVMKNYAFVYDYQDPDEIPEEIPVVFATNTMPFEDFLRSLGFGMLIYNMHAYGWTQFVSRYLCKVHQLDYGCFYEALEDFACSDDGDIVSREYKTTLDTFATMVETGQYVVDRFLNGVNVGTVPIGLRSQGFFHLEWERTNAVIEAFVTSRFGNLCNPKELQEVLRFQRHFVTNPKRTYPYSVEFTSDIGSVLVDRCPEKMLTKYSFSVPFEFEGERDYLSKLYSRKKQGFGKAIVCALTDKTPILS